MDLRCYKCGLFHSCPMVDDSLIKTEYGCIMEYDAINHIRESDDSLDNFILENNPIEYLSYLGFKEKEKYPEPGSHVLTITGGFGSDNWKILKVETSSNDNYISLLDENCNGKYLVMKENWWKYLFKLGEE